MRILLVEDDPEISRFVVQGLQEDGHVVDLEPDGARALQRALGHAYDALILDLMLPGEDGFSVCRRLRQAGSDTPILMLTARDAVRDRVQGLDVGADDYLVKPFAFEELLARLRAVSRRGRGPHSSAVLKAGPLQVDTRAHRTYLHEQPLTLTATEYRLLEYFVRHAGAIVTRDQLADHVWGRDFEPTSNVVDVYVGYLRRKLDAGGARSMLRTVRGLGYMLTSDPELTV